MLHSPDSLPLEVIKERRSRVISRNLENALLIQ